MTELLEQFIDDKFDSDVEIIIQHKKGEKKAVQKVSGNRISILNAFYNLCQTLVNNGACKKEMLIKIIDEMVKDKED